LQLSLEWLQQKIFIEVMPTSIEFAIINAKWEHESKKFKFDDVASVILLLERVMIPICGNQIV
jgi:hypothetical protein